MDEVYMLRYQVPGRHGKQFMRLADDMGTVHDQVSSAFYDGAVAVEVEKVERFTPDQEVDAEIVEEPF